MDNLTESESNYDNLESLPTSELLYGINAEDQTVAKAVEMVIPKIIKLVDQVSLKINSGGRLFYIGAGTSGRLGVVDASECPPTFGVSHDLVIALIAGGDSAIRKAVEFAEDDEEQGWLDLLKYGISEKDALIGIAASGKTPYVVAGLKRAKSEGILTGCITCNEGTPLASVSDCPIEVPVGSEFVTGSTRMKAGTAQKMVLNMISTAVMIKLGRVKGNKMVDMQMTNQKLKKRAIKMIMDELSISREQAAENLEKYGSVRAVLDNYSKGS